MIRAIRLTACLALMLAAAACGPKPRPTALRDMQQNDVQVCAKNAQAGNPNLHGDGTMIMYVDADGAIPAVWFHDAGTLDSPTLFRCITSFGVESKFKPVEPPGDYIIEWGISCEEATCTIKVLNTLPAAPFDESVAKRTLVFADWADPTDKAWGYYYTHRYADAAAAFQAVVDAHPDDIRAQRGLAQSLVESGGDLKKARAAADKAVSLQPKSAATLEALVRVCLKTGDDECVYTNFVALTKAEDVKNRSLDVAPLNDLAKAAADRLAVADKQKEDADMKARAAAHAAAEAKADPLGCGKLDGAEAAKCFIKGCFAAGAQAYAGELSKNMGGHYAAGEVSATGSGPFIVTIPLRPAAEAKHKKASDQDKDAVWEVTLGDSVGMKPYNKNLQAYYISKDHNACKK